MAQRGTSRSLKEEQVAQVTLAELIEILKQHASYPARELGVPAEQALYVSFGEREPGSVESTVMDIVGGHQLVIDRDKDGRVRGIEIV
jgi:hypothetical protein